MQIGIHAVWHWRRVEVIIVPKELYGGEVIIDQVLQEKKLDVSAEISEQMKVVRIPRERGTQRTCFVKVVSPNALDCEIKPVFDLRMKPACTVDCYSAVHTISGEQHHASDCVADIVESGQSFRNPT